jgi:PIN domain nuclease of toxin-antitoxin system
LGLKTSESSFDKIINESLKIKWTRDVFDRLIVSESRLEEIGLVTADSIILKNYRYAIWD